MQKRTSETAVPKHRQIALNFKRIAPAIITPVTAIFSIKQAANKSQKGHLSKEPPKIKEAIVKIIKTEKKKTAQPEMNPSPPCMPAASQQAAAQTAIAKRHAYISFRFLFVKFFKFAFLSFLSS